MVRVDGRGILWHDKTLISSGMKWEEKHHGLASRPRAYAEHMYEALSDLLYARYYTVGGYLRKAEANQLRLTEPKKRIQEQELRKFVRARQEAGWQHSSEPSASIKNAGGTFSDGTVGKLFPSGAGNIAVATNGVRPNLSPGFFFIQGPVALDLRKTVMRAYFNIDEYDRVEFVKELYNGLAEAELAFDVKLMLGPNASSRCDNIVLYSLKEDFVRISTLIFKVINSDNFRIRGLTPLWTYRLSPGIPVADNPSKGASFGKTRCEALATSLINSLFDGNTGVTSSRDVLPNQINSG